MKHPTLPSFFTLTAMSFRRGSYQEAPPCHALSPFVRCFWEERTPAAGDGAAGTLRTHGGGTPVIPDVCADIIVTIEEDADGRSGEVAGIGFCGVSDGPFVSARARRNRLLAIRFYAWTAALFADAPLCGTANGFFDGREHFGTLARRLSSVLAPQMTLAEFKAHAERILLDLRDGAAIPPLVGDAVGLMLGTRGAAPVGTIIGGIHASERQLERLFAAHVALPPKRLASLIRYQSVWQSALLPDFDVQDAVLRHGYTDQAHLLHEFRRFHGMSLGEARSWATASTEDV